MSRRRELRGSNGRGSSKLAFRVLPMVEVVALVVAAGGTLRSRRAHRRW